MQPAALGGGVLLLLLVLRCRAQLRTGLARQASTLHHPHTHTATPQAHARCAQVARWPKCMAEPCAPRHSPLPLLHLRCLPLPFLLRHPLPVRLRLVYHLVQQLHRERA